MDVTLRFSMRLGLASDLLKGWIESSGSSSPKEQINGFLEKSEAGAVVTELRHKHGVSSAIEHA